uniref:Nuclear polyA polymerase 1 n=1 Tax=Rhizophora mucronata TaxID=61149 RepID=A0A2P2L7S9_RHIMU
MTYLLQNCLKPLLLKSFEHPKLTLMDGKDEHHQGKQSLVCSSVLHGLHGSPFQASETCMS